MTQINRNSFAASIISYLVIYMTSRLLIDVFSLGS